MLVLAGLGPPARADDSLMNKPAPALVITKFDGNTFDLAAMKGKVVIINFWATWCPSCQEELSVLRKFYRLYHKHGLEILEISIDKPRVRESARMLMQEYFLPAAIIHDARVNEFKPTGSIPTTYLIDAEGIVRAISLNPLSQADLERGVLPWLMKAQGKL
jgi:cytochrome c biogenesis protein CcmG, thiol:disulfide interchange protein DsbE